MQENSTIAWILVALHVALQILFIVRALLRTHREPSARMAWVLAIVTVPVVGIIAYVLFGETNIGRRRISSAAPGVAYSAAREAPGNLSDRPAESASSRNARTASSESSASVLVPSAGIFFKTSPGAVMMWHPISSASITLKTSRVDAQMISTFLVVRACSIAA